MTRDAVIAGVGPLLVGTVLSGCSREREDAAPRGFVQPVRDSIAEVASAPGASSVAEEPSARALQQSAFHERTAERAALSRALAEQGIQDPAVLRAIGTVPRHAFVPPVARSLAYADRALPIVGGQTISQPYVVAFMTEAARPTVRSKCLEIGTGSGYQAAVLAELCQHTYSIEYRPDVARFGERNLRTLGYGPDRVSLRVGDGYAGWPDAAPFDVVIVTAAPERVPAPLLDQLAVGGRLVIPVGASEGAQDLERWTRIRGGDDPGAFRTETLLPVRFVPFAGDRVAR